MLSRQYRGVQGDVDIVLNSYTTVVDAKKCKMYMRNFGEFFDNQVEYAGAIIMSRTDIIDERKHSRQWNFFVELMRKLLSSPLRLRNWTGRKSLRLMEKPVSLEEELMSEEEVCPECGQTEYPKISPAVIVAISDGDRLLMSRYRVNNNPYRGYALIAGFVEIGESFEETIHREVMEEVGLKVKKYPLL